MRQGLFLTIVSVVSLGLSIGIFMFLPEYIRQGGPLVAGLVMLSIMSVTLVFERLFTLARARGKDPIPTFMRNVRKRIDAMTETWDKIVIDRGSEMRETIPVLQDFLDQGIPVWAYFNNHYAGHAPASVEILKKELGL